MGTLETVLAAIDLANKLYNFAQDSKANMSEADSAAIDAKMNASIAERHAQQAKTVASLDEAAKQ